MPNESKPGVSHGEILSSEVRVQEYTPKGDKPTAIQSASEKSAEPCYCDKCIYSRRGFMRTLFAGVTGVTLYTAVSALNSQRHIRLLTQEIEESAPDPTSESQSLPKTERVNRNPEIRRLSEWRDRMIQIGGAGLAALLGGAYLNSLPPEPFWDKPCGREAWLRDRQSYAESSQNQA